MSAGPFRSQLSAELRIVLRNGEQLLLTMVIPILLLVFFSLTEILPDGFDDPARERIDFLFPGVLALAVMSSAMVSLGIGTGFERGYKVLRRLGVTPLGRPRWLAAKTTAVLAVQLLQVIVLSGVAVACGWRPGDPNEVGPLDVLTSLAAVVSGTVAFAGLGLFLAGRLRAEINLAAQNALYIVLLLLGGMVVSVDELPGILADVAPWLPSGALSDLLRDALAGAGAGGADSWLALGGWAVATPVLAALTFRWE